MRTCLLLIACSLSVHSFGQHVFKVQVLSVADSTPLSNVPYRADGKDDRQTDAAGYFFISTPKKKIKFSIIFAIAPFDTILRLNDLSSDTIRLYTVKAYDAAQGEYDIKKGQVQLFCGLGIAPLAPKASDFALEKKYHFNYHIVGDFLKSSVEQMTAYNNVVAAYLDNQYGKTWRQGLRPDVLGITRIIPN